MGKARDYLMLSTIAGIVVALDQWTKAIVRAKLAIGETWMPIEWLAPYARIVNWNNTGAAFGLFPAGGIIFTGIALLVVLAIIYYFPKVPRQQIAIHLSLALEMGGSIGNLIDRFTRGTVTDIISVGKFPVFNIADSSITIGVAILVIALWIEERRGQEEVDVDNVHVAEEVADSTLDVERRIG